MAKRIDVKNLDVYYGKFHAVSDVTFTINPRRHPALGSRHELDADRTAIECHSRIRYRHRRRLLRVASSNRVTRFLDRRRDNWLVLPR